MRRLAWALVVLALIGVFGAEARFPRGSYGSISAGSTANSQFNPGYLGGAAASFDGTSTGAAEYMLRNRFKESEPWRGDGDNYYPGPADLDAAGYPLTGAIAGHGSYGAIIINAPQSVYPGGYVLTATGNGFIYAFDQSSPSSNVTACTGSISGNGCTNTACTDFTGQISGTTLTVTVAGTGTGCALVVGQPISNVSITVDQFGTPTIITGKSGSANCPTCTGTGGTGTYLVNFSQSVGSGAIHPGIRAVMTDGGGEASPGGPVNWKAGIVTSTSGNTIGNMGLVHQDEEALYATGDIVSTLYKQRVQQANFKYQRNLNPEYTNVQNVTTWATRKPGNYYSWGRFSSEMRSSVYIASPSYVLNGSSNDYAGTLGSGAPVDKQTICFRVPNSATNTTVTFNLNATGTKSILEYRGYPNAAQPIAGRIQGMVFDATLNGWLAMTLAESSCMLNAMPPEAFARVNSETGTSPWIVQPFMAADPITDWMPQYAIYLHTNYPAMTPIWEVPDETWNCAGEGVGGYPSTKSAVYFAIDSVWAAAASGKAACFANGNVNDWTGKAASLLGQVIRTLGYGDVILSGVQTGGTGTAWDANFLSTAYVGQNPANIPTQSGCAGAGAVQTGCPTPFTKTAFYLTTGARGITIANYWELFSWTNTGTERELAWGYCYFYQSAGCASRASILSSLFATQAITGAIPAIAGYWAEWYTNHANNCGGAPSCTPLLIYNYEGGFTYGVEFFNRTNTATASSIPSGGLTALTVGTNGAFVGMTVQISAATGGTWSTVNSNSYTVTAVGASTVTINLNSAGLGTLSSLTLTYTNSSNYITYMRANAYVDAGLSTLETLVYNTISSTTAASACFPAKCSESPSQFLLAQNFGAATWATMGYDIYGYQRIALCSSCTISGANMTLGGTVTGIFTSGLRIFGGSLNTATPGYTISGACSQTGAGPAGSNAGDVCPLNASATVAVGTAISGNAVPPLNGAGTANSSAVKSWPAICAWNGNANQC